MQIDGDEDLTGPYGSEGPASEDRIQFQVVRSVPSRQQVLCLPDAIQDAVGDSDKDTAQAAKRKPAQQGPDPKTLPAKKQKGQAGPANVWNYVASDDSSEMESS